MSVEQLPTRTANARSDSKLLQYDEYIDRQVETTRRVVKVVDLATSLVVLAAGVLIFLLVAAVVEHWIRPGGFSVVERVILFTLLAGSVGWFAVRRIWPLVIRRVNPVYAAHTIESSTSGGTSLKNSLVNLLLFRQKRTDIPDAVYRTLEEQAAQRLSRVPLDSAVDQTTLIRFGYVLVAIVALAALYKIFSPKDPVVAAQRVLMPWADIVPASRVNISDIKPGTTTVSRGEFIDVSAEVRGIGDDDTVLLKYTTVDGRSVGKAVPMRLSGNQLRFEARLPEDGGSSGAVGLSQNLTYRIEAGDARSLDYRVKVVEAPSILVERVEYDYPDYTGYVDRVETTLRDIRAIEGTRVTVHARANGPIKEAEVDFDADGRRDLTMKTSATEASASFVLALRDDRRTPQHASYVLRFTNAEGRKNRNPVKYTIDVEPDYAPEAAITAPREKTVDVRLDETVTIEVTATDPDFALADARIRGQVAGRETLDQPLLAQPHKGRFSGKYEFTPNEHGLKSGDIVEYWVAAKDNREPIANLAESPKQQLRIVSPDPAQQPPPDRLAQRDPSKQNQQGENQPQEGQQQPQNGEGAQEGQPGDGQQGGAGNQGQPGENQQQGSEGQQGDDGAQRGSEGEKGRGGEANAAPQNSESQGDGAESGNQNQSPVSRDAQRSADPEQSPQNDNGEQQATDQQPGGQQTGTRSKPGEQRPNDEQTGAGAAGGDQSKRSQPDGARPDANTNGQPSSDGQSDGQPQGGERSDGEPQNSQPKNGQQQRGTSKAGSRQSDGQKNGDQSSPENREPSPVSSDGDDDGEAFERIQQHLEHNNELNDGQSPSDQQPVSRDAERSAQNETQDQAPAGQQADDTAKPDQKEQRDAAGDGKAERERPGDGSANDRSEDSGAATKEDGEPNAAKQQPGSENEQTKSPGGQETSAKGDSGAGDEQQGRGAPNSQPEMKPTEKRQQSGSDGESTDEQEPPAGARGKKESDSTGEQGGDQSGGGEEGGGQKAPRDGTGSPGQNQSADQGAGRSSEKGDGENSQNAGQDAKTDGKTGESSGDTPGEGSKSRQGQGQQPAGDQPPDEAQDSSEQGDPNDQQGVSRDAQRSAEEQRQGEGEKGRQGDLDSQKQDGNAQPGGKQTPGDDQQPGSDPDAKTNDAEAEPNKVGAPTGGGGLDGTGEAQPSPGSGTAPEGDEANLEYARKQTDLVLNKLADQLKQKDVDKDMLKQLGWSEDDLRKFVERWQARKAAAQRNDPAGDSAKRELDEALRSLGLRPGTMKQGQVKEDTMRDLREGYRGPVPLEYQERLRAYNQGVSRARGDEGQ